MQELTMNEVEQVNGGIWTPYTSIHGDKQNGDGTWSIMTDQERAQAYLFWLAS